MAKGQNLLANISTSRTSLLQGQYLIQEKKTLLLCTYFADDFPLHWHCPVIKADCTSKYW